MTSASSSTFPAEQGLQTLRQPQRLVLVVDLMESVRLMQKNEQATLSRWLGFTQHVQNHLLAQHQAEFIKGLGDGLLMQMQDARLLEPLTRQMHDYFLQVNALLPNEQQMWLRIGCHLTEVFAVNQDIYGSGVNLASRIASLAGPGETVVSAEVKDQLIDGLDAQLIDMGECYLKHVETAQRCYKLKAPNKPFSAQALIPRPSLEDADMPDQVLPAIAVIPFESRVHEVQTLSVGDLIADGVIAQLSRSPQLRVLSRLSTQAMRGRAMTAQEVAAHLCADYLLTGSQVLQGNQLWVQAELVCVAQDRVVWSERIKGSLPDLFEMESQLCQALAQGTHQALLAREAQKALIKPVPNLQSYSLFLGGVQLMHRSHKEDFFRSKTLLDALRERHPRSATLCAWGAKWFVLHATRGLGATDEQNTSRALDLTHRALDIEGQNSFALAMRGFVQLHLMKDMNEALASLEHSTQCNPNEALAWLFKSVVHAFMGNAQQGVWAAQKALHLSPLDPLAYYYQSLAASACLAAHAFDSARDLATLSLQKNTIHPSTFRVLITALVQLGERDRASEEASKFLRLYPQFSIAQYEQASAVKTHVWQHMMRASLLEAGIPLT